MNNYVVIGYDKYFNSILDIISAQGNSLKKIVCQEPQSIQFSQPSLSIPIESLTTFRSTTDETYICGLFGKESLALRQKIREKVKMTFEPLVHPNAMISLTASLGSGSVIAAGVIIASSVVIGENCFVGQGAIFGHDTVLNDDVIVESGAKLAGHVKVGKGVVIGMGATIIEDIVIGDYSIIEPGAVVLKDVPPQTVASGVPAVIHKIY